MELQTRIRRARRQSGLSQDALARKIGVSRSSVSNWEAASSIRPTLAGLRKIATVTGVSVEWLVAGIVPAEGGTYLPLGDETYDLPTVDPDEIRLLLAFRGVSSRGRGLILRYAERISMKR